MAEFSWASRSPLEHALAPGAHGAGGVEAGVSLTEVRNFDLIQVMARRGKAAELARAANGRFGVSAPNAPTVVQAQDAALIWSGPDQFFILSKGGKHTMDTLAPATQPQPGDVVFYPSGYALFWFVDHNQQPFVVGMTPNGIVALEPNFAERIGVRRPSYH